MKLDMISECTGAEILRVQLSGKDISNILDGGKVVWGVNPNLEGVYGLFHCMEIVGEKGVRQAAEYAQEEVKYIE